MASPPPSFFIFSPPPKLLTAAESGCSGGAEEMRARGARGARSRAASSREPRGRPHMAVAGRARGSSPRGRLQLPSLSPVTAATAPRCHPSARGLTLSQGHGSGKPLKGKIFPNYSLLNLCFFSPEVFWDFSSQQHPTPHASEVKNGVPIQQGGTSEMLCWRADLLFSRASLNL